jgi:hypothetical protein
MEQLSSGKPLLILLSSGMRLLPTLHVTLTCLLTVQRWPHQNYQVPRSCFQSCKLTYVGRSDIFRPTERGKGTGWFLSGTLIGPAFGPFLGGLIVTYTSWRVIFWLQTGLAAVGTIGIYLLMPETIFHKRIDDLVGHSGHEKGRALLSMLNPWRVLKLFEYPSMYTPYCTLFGNLDMWSRV